MSSDFLNVRKISFSIAKYMANVQKISHEQRHVYYYSLQIIFGSLFELAFILTLAWLLGILFQTMVCILTFASIRFYAGGYHSNTYLKCFFMTSSLMLGMTYLGVLISGSYSIIVNCMLFLISLFLTYKYAPCDTVNKPVTSAILRKKLLIKSLLLNIFWFSITICLLVNSKISDFASVIGIAMFVEALSLTPVIADKAPLRKNNMQ